MAKVTFLEGQKSWSLTAGDYEASAAEVLGGVVVVNIRGAEVATMFEAKNISQAEKLVEFFIDEQLLADAAYKVKADAEKDKDK